METYRIRYLGGPNFGPAIALVREIAGVELRQAEELVLMHAVLLDHVSLAEARHVAQRFAEIGSEVAVELADGSPRPADAEMAQLEAASVRDRAVEAQLRARPDDVAAHLVYGDWLQTRGDPRGQLIMLAHAGERVAEREFRSRHLDHLFGPLRELADALVVRWSLGFIDAAFVGVGVGLGPDQGPMQVLRDLLRLPIAARMTSLGLTSTLLHHPSLESVLCGSEVVASLRELELGDHLNPHGAPPVPKFVRLWAHLHELRKLTIHGDYPPLDTLRVPTLEHLELHVRRRASFPESAANLSQLRTLTLVDHAGLPGAVYIHLFELPGLDGLRELIVRLPNHELNYGLVGLFTNAPRLAALDVLDLSRCVADERAIEALVSARDRGWLPAGLRLPVRSR